MAKLLVLYKTPTDAEAFDAYYADRHAPLVKAIPGLVGYETSTGPVIGPQGVGEVYCIAQMSFDSLAALQEALSTPEGQAAASDIANFATGGAELLMFETGAP